MPRKKKVNPDQVSMTMPTSKEDGLYDDESDNPKSKTRKKKSTSKQSEPIEHESKDQLDHAYTDPPPPGFKRVMFRCTHTPFGFCMGQPEWSTLPVTHDGLNFHSGVCGNSFDKCCKFTKKLIPMKDAPLIPFNSGSLIFELYKD